MNVSELPGKGVKFPRQTAQFHTCLAQADAVGVRGVRNFGGLVVANGGRERSHQHERVFHMGVNVGMAVRYAFALSTLRILWD